MCVHVGQRYTFFVRLDFNITFKTAKRAETRPCPVCDESIPLRLMSTHAALEFERVEQIMRAIGSKEATDDDGLEEGCVVKIVMPYFTS